MRVRAGGQQQCVNPGHPRVRLSHSSIHCCLVFLLASVLRLLLLQLLLSPFPPTPTPHPPRHSSDFFKSVLLWRIPLLLVLLLLEETKTGWKNSHHLLLRELLTMQIPSLSSSALSSLFLPPSLPPCYCWCSVLSHFLFLLPLSRPSSNSNSYLVSHFSTCSDTG